MRTACFILLALVCALPAISQTREGLLSPELGRELPDAPQPNIATESASPQAAAGTIVGTIVDQTGTAVVGAQVRLTRAEQLNAPLVLTDEDGRFLFTAVDPGPFQITITAPGFATQVAGGVLNSGQNYVVPRISLGLATARTEVKVELSTVELAQEQLKDQEQQRVLGFIPNFYVSYVPDAAPLNARQKYQLAWKTTVDPVSILIVGAIAGGDQAANRFSGYGQGAQGYGKRFGASYADFVIGTFIGGAVLPSVLKQDPRYFYKGTGSKKSRLMYALGNAVICKGDNGRWQPNYSSIIGNFAAGAISNAYYPASDRNGAGLTVANALIGIGGNAAANVIQEFILKKFTSKVPNQAPATP